VDFTSSLDHDVIADLVHWTLLCHCIDL
jgi:hypothetical protein